MFPVLRVLYVRLRRERAAQMLPVQQPAAAAVVVLRTPKARQRGMSVMLR